MKFFNALLIILGALVIWVDAQATSLTSSVGVVSSSDSPPAQTTDTGLQNSPTSVQLTTSSDVATTPLPVPVTSTTPSPVDTTSSPVVTTAPPPPPPPPPANTPSTDTAVQGSPSVVNSPTSTPGQTLTTDPSSSPSVSDTVPTQPSTNTIDTTDTTGATDSTLLATPTTPATVSQSSTPSTIVLQPTPCLSTGQKLSLSSCADTTNYYCNTTTSMCVPKLNDNSSCTDSLMCHSNSTCQNLVCVPLPANSSGSSGGASIGKVGIIAGSIAGIFVLAGIAFWAYRFLSKRKELEENNRRMRESYGSKTNSTLETSTLETSTDYPFVSRTNSFSNSNTPPPVVTRPEMRTLGTQGFGGAMNNGPYGMPPPTNQYNQQRTNNDYLGGNNYTEGEDTGRFSKYNYLSSAFTRMRNSLGYGLSNSQPENSYGKDSLPFTTTTNNGSRTGTSPQASPSINESNVARNANYRFSDVENNLEDNSEDNTTLRDSSVLPADDNEVFSLASESIYLGLDMSDQSAQQDTKKRYKMDSMYSHYTESWGSNHMLGDAPLMPTGPAAYQLTKDKKNLRDKKNTGSARTTLHLPNDDPATRQSVMEFNSPIFNLASMRQKQHLQQPSVASVASSGYSLNYYNSPHATERTLAPVNERGRLVYSSTFGDESENNSSSGEDNLTIEEKLSRQEYIYNQGISDDISELEKDIESVRKFADREWDD